jgi:hypothetical protein
MAAQRAQRTEEAIALYQEAIALAPELARAHWELGWSYFVLGDYAAVLRCWDRVRELEPEFPELDEYYPLARSSLEVRQAAERARREGRPLPLPLPPGWSGASLRVAAVGDIMMGSDYPPGKGRLPAGDGEELFRDVASFLRSADLALGNLEGVLADGGETTKCARRKSCHVFRTPRRYAGALAAAGFDVLNLANNHSHDFGEEGLRQTLETLEQWGIAATGLMGLTASVEVRGLRVAVLGAAPNRGCYPLNDIDLLRSVVAALARDHHLVIVTLHGGAEGLRALHVPRGEEVYLGERRGDLRRVAHALVDAGADLVVGHGPHVLRAMEIYRGRLIAYSLGNFCVHGGFSLVGPLGISALLEVALAPDGRLAGARVVPLRLVPPGIPRIDPDGEALALLERLGREDFPRSAALFGPDGELLHDGEELSPSAGAAPSESTSGAAEAPVPLGGR